MGKFNLNDILSERSKNEVNADMSTDVIRTEGVIELIDIYKIIPSPDNFYSTDKIMDLVTSIRLVGILQPVRLTESEEESDMYNINTGHRRLEACKYLVEQEGMEKFRYIPAIIKEDKDDINSYLQGESKESWEKLVLIMANRFRDKTDWEKMQEVIQTEELLNKLKGDKALNDNTRQYLKESLGVDMDGKAKTRDFVAQILGTSSTQVARFKNIYKHICQELMELFKEDKINISVANEAARLSPEGQQRAFDIYTEQETLSLGEIKQIAQAEEAAKPLEGQMYIDDVIIKGPAEEKTEDIKCQPDTKPVESDELEDEQTEIILGEDDKWENDEVISDCTDETDCEEYETVIDDESPEEAEQEQIEEQEVKIELIEEQEAEIELIGGYDITTVDNLLIRHEEYFKQAMKSNAYKAVYSEACLVDALRLLKQRYEKEFKY